MMSSSNYVLVFCNSRNIQSVFLKGVSNQYSILMNRFQVSIQEDCLAIRGDDSIFVARFTHTIDSLSLLLLSDSGNELSVKRESTLNVKFIDSFSCDGILGLYKLSRGIRIYQI